jgi:hypothetical protein
MPTLTMMKAREGADVDHLGEDLDLGEAGEQGDDDAAQDLRAGRRAALLGGAAQEAGQQAVAAEAKTTRARPMSSTMMTVVRPMRLPIEMTPRPSRRRRAGRPWPGTGARLAEVGVGDHAGDDEGHEDVEHRDDGQAGEDAARQGPARVLDLFGRGRDDVEADEGEEDQRGARR